MTAILRAILATVLAVATPVPAPRATAPTSPREVPLAASQTLPSTDAPASAAAVRFTTVDVFVEPDGRPLAAYQFTLRCDAGTALLAGLEGGDHPAFAHPPYYDPKALLAERVVVAALSTDAALPRGRTRVARLHVQVTGPADPAFEGTLNVAAGPDGSAVGATVTVEPARRGQGPAGSR